MSLTESPGEETLAHSLLLPCCLVPEHPPRDVAEHQGSASSSRVIFCVCHRTLSPCSSFHRELDVPLPDIDYMEIPVDWWDAEADKSLLIGVFKHGVYFNECFPFPENPVVQFHVSSRKQSFTSVLSEFKPDEWMSHEKTVNVRMSAELQVGDCGRKELVQCVSSSHSPVHTRAWGRLTLVHSCSLNILASAWRIVGT